MADIWLVLGGARSGKTRRGLALVSPLASCTYIATAEARDEEMRNRIAHHRDERGRQWATIEEPLDLCGALTRAATADGGILVDCLTLWLSNLMERDRNPEEEARKLVVSLGKLSGRIVLVSNEVGLGIVPDNALARAFRDAQGRLNQLVASVANHVELIVAGLPLTIK